MRVFYEGVRKPASENRPLAGGGSRPMRECLGATRFSPFGFTVFARQGSASTTVSGLTVEGTYVFTLTAVARGKFATRDVSVEVRRGSLRVRGFASYN